MKLTKKLLILAPVMCAVLCVLAMTAPAESGDSSASHKALEKDAAAEKPDLENVVSCRELSFEEAAARKADGDGGTCEAAEEALLAEEDRILAEGGAEIAYFAYEGIFPDPEEPDLKCAISATIVTFLDSTGAKLIDRVDSFSSRAAEGVAYEWIEMDTSLNISYDRESVRLSATGYFSSELRFPGTLAVTYYLRSDTMNAVDVYSVH